MKKTHFPAYEIHVGEHVQALEGMATEIAFWKQHADIDRLADYVFNRWPNWFNAHINSMDFVTANFAVSQGFDPNAVAA
jgi:hemerythrin